MYEVMSENSEPVANLMPIPVHSLSGVGMSPPTQRVKYRAEQTIAIVMKRTTAQAERSIHRIVVECSGFFLGSGTSVTAE